MSYSHHTRSALMAILSMPIICARALLPENVPRLHCQQSDSVKLVCKLRISSKTVDQILAVFKANMDKIRLGPVLNLTAIYFVFYG
jgi:hypothetical protein